MRGTFKAADVEVLTGISIEAQKGWNKRSEKLGLDRLGEGNGHRNYNLVDLCFFVLIELLKSRGVQLNEALSGALSRESSADVAPRYIDACSDIRMRLASVFATHIVELPVDTDVMLYVPMQGQHHVPTWFLSALPSEAHAGVGGVDPAISLDAVYDAVLAADNVISVNVSRLARRLIEKLQTHGVALLKQREAVNAFFGEADAE